MASMSSSTYAADELGGALQGFLSKTKAAVNQAVVQASGEPPSTGDRSLRMEPEVIATGFDFRQFLQGSSPPAASYAAPAKPRIDMYYLPNRFPRLQVSSTSGLDPYSMDSFLTSSYGYRNSEQMFCDTVRQTLVESEGASSPAGNLTNGEVITAILTQSGSWTMQGFDGNYASKKVRFLDEFGGDLTSTTKKAYLLSLQQKPVQEIEAIRFLSKPEADAFQGQCYAAVGGAPEIDALEFSPAEEDYLLNRIPEVRTVLAKMRAEQGAAQAREAARAARDRRIELEREAKEQEQELARQQALEARRARDAAEADKLQESISQVQREQAQLNEKKEAAAKAQRDQADADARKKAALEALGR